MFHRPGRSVGRSHRSHRRRALLLRSGGICNGVHLNLAKQFRNLFRGSASALLHASGSPAEEAAVSRCSRNVRPSNGLIPEGKSGGVFWFYGCPPRIRWVASPPVSPILLELAQIFFRFFWLLKMYRTRPGRYIFFAFFSQIRAKKFIFGAIFAL